MSRGESVTASVLDRICNSLDCKIENVVEITPDKTLDLHKGIVSGEKNSL